MTQLIADVLKRDEEERLRQAANIPGVRGLYAPFYDDTTRSVYDAADVLAGRAAAMMRGDPFSAWAGTPTGLDIVEFAMPEMWDAAEYHAPTARYRAQ